VVDDDVVEASNLQRQVIHTTANVGRPKVVSAVEAVQALNPLVKAVAHHERLTQSNATELFSQYDLILDGADNFPTRYLVCDAATEVNVPVLWGSVLGFDAQLSLFWADPPAGVGVTLRDVFPTPPAPGSVPSCSQAGVVGAMVGQVGAVMGGEAVKLIVGVGDSLLGRIIVFDQLRTRWTSIPVRPKKTSNATPPPDAAPSPTPSRVVAANKPGVSYVDDVPQDGLLVDVREDDEVTQGMIPGAQHIPLALILTERGRQGLDPAVPLVIYCGVGPRAERAAQELSQHGFRTHVLKGGYVMWRMRHQSLEKS